MTASIIRLPSAWVEHYPSIRMWDEDVYAGRALAFIGHRILFEQLPAMSEQIITDLRFIEHMEVGHG